MMHQLTSVKLLSPGFGTKKISFLLLEGATSLRYGGDLSPYFVSVQGTVMNGATQGLATFILFWV